MSDEKQPRPTKRVADPEIQALAKIDAAISEALEGLSEEAQSRVMSWVKGKWFSEIENIKAIAGEVLSLARDMARVETNGLAREMERVS